MAPTLRDILWLMGVPALLAAVAMLASRPWRRGRDLGGWSAAVAIAGGFAIAFTHLYGGIPDFPPTAAQQWLVFLGVPVTLVAIIQAMVRSRWFGIVASALLLGVTPWLLLRKASFIEPRMLWAWSGGAAAAMIGWWGAMELLARRARGGSLPLLLGVATGVAGVAIMNAKNISFGQAIGSVAVPLMVVALAALWAKGASLTRGGTLAAAVVLLGGLLFAYVFASLTMRDLVVLSLAPLAAWAGELPGLGKPDSWKRVAVRTVAVLVVLALPAFHAATGLKKTADETFDASSY